MPWHKVRDHKECPSDKPVAVVKDSDGSVAGCFANESDADVQIAALYASDSASAESLTTQSLQDDNNETYAMIAFIPTPEEAVQLSIPDGQDPSLSHLTLVYLGPNATQELNRSEVEKAVGVVANEFGPISGIYNGTCRFGPADDDNPIAGEAKIPVVTTFDASGLDVFRVALVTSLRSSGIDYPQDTHGLLPHTTLGYWAPDQVPDPFPEPSMLEVTYSDVCVCWGDYVTNPDNLTRFPLRGEENHSVKPLEDMTTSTTMKIGPTVHTLSVPGGVVTFTSTATTGTVLQDQSTVFVDSPDEIIETLAPEWESRVVLENVPTDDGREPFGLQFRDPPFSAEWTDEEPIVGHAGAKRFGTVTSVERRNGNEVWLQGVYIDSETAAEVRRLADQGEEKAAAGFPSVQVSGPESSKPEEFIEVNENGDVIHKFTGTLVGFALVPIQAQSGTFFRNLVSAEESDAIAASIPVSPPAEWFEDPKLSAPTPLTVTDEGRVFGHFAIWDGPDACYAGREGCTKPPRSEDPSYSRFRCGHVMTAEGRKVLTGSIVLSGGHRSLHEIARGHADTRMGVADVVVGEDRFGPWVAGALRPGVPPEDIRIMRASALSGEWLGRELLGITCVNRPGFLVRALAASAGIAMIAVGPSQEGTVELQDAPTDAPIENDPLAIAQAALERLADPTPLSAPDDSGNVDPAAEVAARLTYASDACAQMNGEPMDDTQEPSAEMMAIEKVGEKIDALAAAFEARTLSDLDHRIMAGLDERVG